MLIASYAKESAVQAKHSADLGERTACSPPGKSNTSVSQSVMLSASTARLEMSTVGVLRVIKLHYVSLLYSLLRVFLYVNNVVPNPIVIPNAGRHTIWW